MRKLSVLLVVGLAFSSLPASADPSQRADRRSGVQAAGGATGGVSSGSGSGARVFGDFDDDGKDDLVVGVPGEDVGAVNGAGAIQIFYGESGGLSTSTSQLVTESDTPDTTPSGNNGSQPGDNFGASLAAADFDNDGFTDLAIGSPGEAAGLGAVTILYGSASGLLLTGAQFFQGPNLGAPHGETGASLAAGKFDTGPTFDLAIGIPGADNTDLEEPATNAGAVAIAYGTPNGLDLNGIDDPENVNVLAQWEQGVEGRPEDNERFGSSLAAGNFGRNGQWDLAVGVPQDYINGTQSGSVAVFYGGSATIIGEELNGLFTATDQLWSQGSVGVADQPEEPDVFGIGLAASNLGKSQHADLAIGAPGEGVGSMEAVGVMHVLFGSASGIVSKGSKVLSQNTTGVPDSSEMFDAFGFSIAAGDFDGDGDNDVAVAAPQESFGSGVTEAFAAGQVTVIPSGDNGPTGAGSKTWSQKTTGIPDEPELTDFFGLTLAVGNFGRTGAADLAIGAPRETLNDDAIDPLENAGAVHVLFGTSDGLKAANDQFITQDCSGCPDTAEDGDLFGSGLG